jgi:hypothetical protein
LSISLGIVNIRDIHTISIAISSINLWILNENTFKIVYKNMMFRKRLSRWFRLLTATLFVAMVWMVAMVVYLDRAVNHDRSRSRGQRSDLPMRNKLRGILGHNQDVNLDRPDFVQNVIVIAEESLEDQKMSSSTRKIVNSEKADFEIDNSGPFYIDGKNDIGQVTKEDHFQFNQEQINNGRQNVKGSDGSHFENNVVSNRLMHLRPTTLGSRGQILPSLSRNKVGSNQHTTKFGSFSHNHPQKQTKVFKPPVTMVTDPPTTQIIPTLRKPEFQRLSLPFCANAKGCYLSPYRTMTEDEERDLDHGMKRHAFNVRASEKKALDRRIPDTRPSR